MAVGEVFGSPEVLAAYYGGDALDGLNLAFNFRMIGGYGDPHTEWDAATFRDIVAEAESSLPQGAWPNYVLGNHDQSRPMTRYGRDGHGPERARAAAVLLLTLRGTPFLYYGDEIGMADVPIPEDLAQDPARFQTIGRDPERTPMQWTSGPNAGFTTGRPWLPIGDASVNAFHQTNDPESLLSLYKRLIWLRRRSPVLHDGAYASLDHVPDGVFAFERRLDHDRVVVAVNFTSEQRVVPLPEGLATARVVCSTVVRRDGEVIREPTLTLAPFEGCIVAPANG
jgi:alpha-glucosidase